MIVLCRTVNPSTLLIHRSHSHGRNSRVAQGSSILNITAPAIFLKALLLAARLQLCQLEVICEHLDCQNSLLSVSSKKDWYNSPD